MIGGLRQNSLLHRHSFVTVFSFLFPSSRPHHDSQPPRLSPPFPHLLPLLSLACSSSFPSLSFMCPPLFFYPFSPPVILLTAVLQLLRITVGKRMSVIEIRDCAFIATVWFSGQPLFLWVVFIINSLRLMLIYGASLYSQQWFDVVMIDLVSTSSLSSSSCIQLLQCSCCQAHIHQQLFIPLFFILYFLCLPFV